MKKFILCILTISMLCVNCYAFNDIQDATVDNAVQTLSEFSIINGYDDGTFKPNNTITRAEFAKIIVAMANLYQAPENSNTFRDVSSHWAKEYINIAKDKEIIDGISDNMFAPDDNVTYEQSIKMIVCALGYGEEAENLGGYPDGYLELARDLGVTNRVIFTNTSYATRGNIAVMIDDALQVPFYSIGNSDGVIERFNTNKTLYEIHTDLLEFNQIDDDCNYYYDDYDIDNAVG